MDSEILKGFIDEAEGYIPAIRGAILLRREAKDSNGGLHSALKQIQTIKGASSMIGMNDISETAQELEDRLGAIENEGCEFTGQEETELLDLVVKLEATIADIRLASEDFEIEADTLIEESFENLQSGEFSRDEITGEQESEEIEEDSFEDFEIDDEMLEIFAMEAEDHLKNINDNLELLENDANDREALLEIRRSSHTLKGSAGIVGLARLSKLAHKVEDLLDFISENEIDSNEDIFQLLLAATDCISALISNENIEEYEEQISRTSNRCDELFRSLKGTDSETTEDAADKTEETRLVTVSAPKSRIAVNEEERPAQPAPPSTRSVIRVSLDKLDDLVKLTGELVFSRSVFEQRLSELEQQIDELQLSTRRLQRSTGRLETDFDSGVPGPGSMFKGSPQVIPALNVFEGNATGFGSLEFDTLEFDRYTGFHETTRELLETTSDTFAINSELDTVHSFLELLFDNQKRLIDELQDKLLSLRMVSFGTLTARLQRTVRVTAEEEEKQVELLISGENLDVDTQILDSLVEPLLHLLRNAVAHGIEPPETRRLLGKEEKGKISMTVFSEGTHIILTISDDGRGISSDSLKQKALSLGMIDEAESASMSEQEALALMFLPGLTTADRISQVSGRGVGMNIVKTNINRRQGTINVSSELQKGTTFTIRLPMALAVTRTLLVDADGSKYAFPLKLVKHVSEISPKNLVKARKEKKIRLGDISYTVSHLNELLGLPVTEKSDDRDVPLLLLDTITKPCALVVDRIVRPEEVVIKPLGKPLKDLPDLLGATVLGDGSVVPVLDLVHLLNEEKPDKRRRIKASPAKVKQKLRVMIVDDSPSVRHVNTNLVKNNDWEPLVAKDGLEALELLQTVGTHVPDIILTDVEMPEMDGYELLASLKQQDLFKDIPVVMITSRASDKHRRKAFDLGVSEYVTKPYEDSKLVEIIKRLTS